MARSFSPSALLHMRSRSSTSSPTRTQSRFDFFYFNFPCFALLCFADMLLLTYRFSSMPLSTLAPVKTRRGSALKELSVARQLTSHLCEESIKRSRFSPSAYVQLHSLSMCVPLTHVISDTGNRNSQRQISRGMPGG
jgi:hypothetical protein